MKKKIISLFTVVAVLFCSTTMNVFALNEPEVNHDIPHNNPILKWQQAASISMQLAFNGTRANCYSNIIGYRDTQSITGYCKLQRVNPDGTWDFVKSWHGLKGTRSLNINKYCTVEKGYSYRFSIDVTLTGPDGDTENIILDTIEPCD